MTDDVRAVLSGERRWAVVRGDSAEVLATLPPSSVDAVVCDPPAGIKFMNLAFDHDRGGRAQWVAWLAGILASARVATKDGGRMFAWALPRTSHWTGCAVEDAGWSIENVVTHLFATGWPKGSSQLKPASETWWLARTGRSTPLNIEACRVGDTKNVPGSLNVGKVSSYLGGAARSGTREDHTGTNPNVGRYPPNVLLSHAEGCVYEGTRRVKAEGGTDVIRRGATTGRGAGYGSTATGGVVGRPHRDEDGMETVATWRCVEGCVVAELDAQSGESQSSDRPRHNGARPVTPSKGAESARVTLGFADAGGASRFYPQFPADDPSDPWNAPLFRYVAKPSRAEKEAGCDALAAEPRVQISGTFQDARPHTHEGYVYEPEAVRNIHSTVKPIALMRWLIRLITQPGDLVIDPFGGSGTTGAAALLEGRRVVIIEKERRFVDIARARCEHAAPTPERLARVATEPVRVVAPDYGPLFGGRP